MPDRRPGDLSKMIDTYTEGLTASPGSYNTSFCPGPNRVSIWQYPQAFFLKTPL